jgi:hypothetical protein
MQARAVRGVVAAASVPRAHELPEPADRDEVLVDAEPMDLRRVRGVHRPLAVVRVRAVVGASGDLEALAAALEARSAVGHAGAARGAARGKRAAPAAAGRVPAAARRASTAVLAATRRRADGADGRTAARDAGGLSTTARAAPVIAVAFSGRRPAGRAVRAVRVVAVVARSFADAERHDQRRARAACHGEREHGQPRPRAHSASAVSRAVSPRKVS